VRDILFRGKRIDNGEWVEGFYYKMAETTYYLIWRIFAVAGNSFDNPELLQEAEK
jgi:hypothetical protein